MAQYRKTVFNLSSGPGQAIEDPRVAEMQRQQQIMLEQERAQNDVRLREQAMAQQAAQARMENMIAQGRLGLDREKFGASMQEAAVERALREKLFGAGHENAMELAQLREGGLDSRALADRTFQGEQGDLARALQERLAVGREGGMNRRHGEKLAHDRDLFGKGNEFNLLMQRLRTLGEKEAQERRFGFEGRQRGYDRAERREDRLGRREDNRLMREDAARDRELMAEEKRREWEKQRMRSRRDYDLRKKEVGLREADLGLRVKQHKAAMAQLEANTNKETRAALQPLIEQISSGKASESDVRKARIRARQLDQIHPGASKFFDYYLNQSGAFEDAQREFIVEDNRATGPVSYLREAFNELLNTFSRGGSSREAELQRVMEAGGGSSSLGVGSKLEHELLLKHLGVR